MLLEKEYFDIWMRRLLEVLERIEQVQNRQSNPHIRYYKMGRNYMTIMICVGCFMSVSVRYSDIVLNMDYPTKC